MDEGIREMLARLEGVRPRRMRHTLVRCVELASLIEDGRPDFLYTSGKRDRYNLQGVACIYFAEDEETARAEHRCQDHPRHRFRPVCTFFADALVHIVDLTDRSVRIALGVTERDLRAPWEKIRRPTRTQLLGTAICQQQRFSAVRYPSGAARAHGFSGHNVVIFRASVKRPGFVRVLGPGRKPLQSWP